jgi:hypothetical protein
MGTEGPFPVGKAQPGLMLKVENFLICLVGTRIPTVSMMEWQLILPLETLIRNKASRCHKNNNNNNDNDDDYDDSDNNNNNNNFFFLIIIKLMR